MFRQGGGGHLLVNTAFAVAGGNLDGSTLTSMRECV